MIYIIHLTLSNHLFAHLFLPPLLTPIKIEMLVGKPPGTFLVRPYEEAKKGMVYALHLMTNEKIVHLLITCFQGKPCTLNKKDLNDVAKPRAIRQVIERLRDPVGTPLADVCALRESVNSSDYMQLGAEPTEHEEENAELAKIEAL